MRNRSLATALIGAALLVTGCGSDSPAPAAASPRPAASPEPVGVEAATVCDQPESRPVLKRGASGDDVRELQQALELAPDGVFGPETERALREFQRDNALSADGVVGDRTWQALDLVCAGVASESAAPAATPPASQQAPPQPAAPTSPPTTSLGTDVIVTIDTARRSGSTISVSGTATVPDGAFVAYEVIPTLGGMSMKEGAARVQGGRFSFDANVSGFPSGPIEVWVAFVTILGGPTYDATQPSSVLDLYGSMGQNITGPNVTPGLLRLVEVIKIVN